MDFRDYAKTETSAFVGRLIAAAEASAAQVRLWADEEIAKLHAEADGLREQAETLRGQTDSDREANAGLREEANGLRQQTDRLHGEIDRLRAELDTEAAHAASLAADLEGLRQNRREAEDQLLQAAAARAHTEAELHDVREQLDAARADLTRLSEAFRTEVSRAAAALEAEAVQNTRTQEAHDESLREIQARHEALVRDVQAQHDETVRQLHAQHGDAVRAVQTEHDETVRQLHAQHGDALGAVRTEHDEAVRQLQAHQEETVRQLQTQLEAAQSERQGQAERAGALEERLQNVDGALMTLRSQVEDANAIADAVHHGMAEMRTQSQRVMTLLRGSMKALDALGATATAADIFGTLVTLLAAEFPRVAIFRLHGNHLQGELAAGVDDSIDITKLVIPVNLDSVISRAAAAGMLEQATAEQIAASRPPFGGTPASALAAPLTFQGDTLAVVYADSDDAPNDAHAAFAGILVSHANVLLSRLAQELKTAKVLREYAQMLLHEAEQMYLADLEEGRTEPDRLRRLHDTIEFGRQLYHQRAALEGSAAAGLLEDEIAALIRAEPVTRFGSGLAAALAEARAERTAS